MTSIVKDASQLEQEMMAIIESGGRLEKDSPMTADYRENLDLERSKGRTFKLTLAKQFDY